MGEAQEKDLKVLLYSKKGSFQNNNTATWAERSRFNEWWDCQNSDCKENIPTFLSEFFLRANPISKSSFSSTQKCFQMSQKWLSWKKRTFQSHDRKKPDWLWIIHNHFCHWSMPSWPRMVTFSLTYTSFTK